MWRLSQEMVWCVIVLRILETYFYREKYIHGLIPSPANTLILVQTWTENLVSLKLTEIIGFLFRWSPVDLSPRLPSGRLSRAITTASEGSREDGVHRLSDQAARGSIRAHRLPARGGARRSGEEHRAERGNREGEYTSHVIVTFLSEWGAEIREAA